MESLRPEGLSYWELRRLQALVDGDADLEAGFAGDGVEVDGAAVFADDALDGVEAKAGAVADALGGEEGFEDVRLNVFGDGRSRCR